jgi:diketogulonate reductase-like aldo/keto reductase
MTTTARTFGNAGAQVPVIGQGTWQMEGDDRASAIAALRTGIELGMTHIDTAELYGSGRVEEMVAQAIAGTARASLYLVSKVMPSHASREGTLRACEQTLKRLRTDYLDCYLLHWPGSHPLEQTIAAFETLQRDGKIRAWGVSNFEVSELHHAEAIAGAGRIACNQVLYHLAERDVEREVVPWCEAHGVAVVGYTPFGRGPFPARGAAGQTLTRIAQRHSASERQVALAFLTRAPCMFGIPKASRAAHVRDNASAAALKLTAAEITELDAAFPVAKKRRS